MALVSVPLWLIDLSVQLPVIALVGRYPTNKLIGRRLIPVRRSFTLSGTIGYYPTFRRVIPVTEVDSYALLTRSPRLLLLAEQRTFDLHTLGTPQAFILSQDQTLKKDVPSLTPMSRFLGLPFDKLGVNKKPRRRGLKTLDRVMSIYAPISVVTLATP
jgi:hypothetical protein